MTIILHIENIKIHHGCSENGMGQYLRRNARAKLALAHSEDSQ